MIAAVRFDPHQAKGMDATLRSFAHTPAGPRLPVLATRASFVDEASCHSLKS